MENKRRKTGARGKNLDTLGKRLLVLTLAILMTFQFSTMSLSGVAFALSDQEAAEAQALEQADQTEQTPAPEKTQEVQNSPPKETKVEAPAPKEEVKAEEPKVEEKEVKEETPTEVKEEVKTESKTEVKEETPDDSEEGQKEDAEVKEDTPVVSDAENTSDEVSEEEAVEEPVDDEEPEDDEVKLNSETMHFEKTINRVTVNVTASPGTFPEGTKMKVETVSKAAVQAAVEKAMGGEVGDFRAVDITFYTEDETDIQPLKPVKVQMATTAFDSDEDLAVVHIENLKKNKAEVMDLDDRKSDDTKAVFTTDGFSIYVVVETGEDARLKVNFVKADGSTVTEMINERQIEQINQYIYDPGVGTLPEGAMFVGWTTEENYTSETAKKTIAKVREDVTGILQDGVTDGQEVTYYAMVFKPYTVTYVDEKGIMVKSDQKLVRVNADAPEYEVTENYTPYPTGEEGVVAEFMGWQQISPEVPGEMVLYKPGDKFDMEAAEYTLKAYTQKGHWLIFEENLSNAPYTQPQFVSLSGTTEEPTAPTRTGYTFDGWYTEDASAARDGQVAGTEFTFGQTLDANTVVYGKWTKGTRANYNVVIWLQNKEGTGYDYSGTTVTVNNATVGTNTYQVTARGNGNGRYARIYTSNNNYTDYNTQFPGFHLSTTKPNANGYDNPKPVAPEGNTVINVYYDRNEITYIFRGYKYTETTSNNGTQYGIVDGAYVELTRSGGRWYYYDYGWHEYNGTRYTRSADDLTFTGLYGSDFTEWPDPGEGHVPGAGRPRVDLRGAGSCLA